MKRRTRSLPKHPTTYEEIVAFQHELHAHRLSQLKRAEKAIRAISAELASLAERGMLVGVGHASMYLLDCKHYFGRSKSALFLDSGIFRTQGNRLVEGFISFGWIVEAAKVEGLPLVLLRRPKTQTRIVLDVTDEFARALQAQETQQ